MRPSGRRELGFLALVYVGYALTRVLASNALAPAITRARRLVDIEQPLGLAFEQPLNDWLAGHDLFGTLAAFHYASAHYVVTTALLVWLFFRRPEVYVLARRTLVIATAIALARDNDLNIVFFNLSEPGNIARVVDGEQIGTLVTR